MHWAAESGNSMPTSRNVFHKANLELNEQAFPRHEVGECLSFFPPSSSYNPGCARSEAGDLGQWDVNKEVSPG